MNRDRQGADNLLRARLMKRYIRSLTVAIQHANELTCDAEQPSKLGSIG